MARLKTGKMDTVLPGGKESEGQTNAGRIEYFEKFTGLGRIVQKDSTTIPFHINRATYSVKEGDVVNYRIETGPRGLQAVDISRRDLINLR